jgi:hypothetical protein
MHVPYVYLIIILAAVIYLGIFIVKWYSRIPFKELKSEVKFQKLKDMLRYEKRKTSDTILTQKLEQMLNDLKTDHESNPSGFNYDLWVIDSFKNKIGKDEIDEKMNAFYTPSEFISNHQAHLVMIIFVIFSVLFVLTIENEYQSMNIVSSVINTTAMIVEIDKESPLNLATNTILHDRLTQLNVTTYYTPSITIESIKLSPVASSYLSFPKNNELILRNVSLGKKNISITSINDTMLNQTSKTSMLNTIKGQKLVKEEYFINLHARNTGIVQNLTEGFNLTISYFKNGTLESIYIPFNMDINIKDLPLVVYFLIVLLGVLVSRMITIISAKIRLGLSAEYYKLNLEESMWIIFSIIIAVIGFSAFNETIKQFTANVLGNIAVAFGFGFASEKILELARGFSSRFFPSPGEESKQ